MAVHVQSPSPFSRAAGRPFESKAGSDHFYPRAKLYGPHGEERRSQPKNWSHPRWLRRVSNHESPRARPPSPSRRALAVKTDLRTRLLARPLRLRAEISSVTVIQTHRHLRTKD